jgi:heptose-I-phosphate ethanolaminephosphotransferase
VHAASFAAEIDAEGYRAIFQTSVAEALEFLSRFVATWMPAAAAALLVLVVVVAWFAPAARLPGVALAWAAPYALAALALAYATAGPVLARLQAYTEAYEYFSELRAYRELREARNRMRPLPAVSQAPAWASEPQTYVFAIGESLTRNHMSLYGYWRETTPELDRVAEELAVFTDVVSPHSHTDPSLERVLTLANDANGLRFSDPANHGLIELLRAAGFATWWISNQNTAGPWDNKTAVLASAADHVRYLNEGTGPFVSGAYDDVLLEPFAAALAHPAPRKAIFLHFLGNHWEYVRRYPPEESVFSAPHGPGETGARAEVQANRLAVVNYDNAVRYQDKLLGRVLARLREAGGASAFVFLSDHGESVFDGKGHHWKLYTREHVEVPLVVWLSPGLRRLAPGTWERARAAAARPFALEDFPHLVADLAGLESAVFERPRSPVSGSYRAPHARRVLNGVRVYEEGDDGLLQAQRALAQFGEVRPRLWAHRVNTLGKMMEAARAFHGVEMDVLFQRGELLVNHPPAPVSGLTLDEQLAYANRLNPKLALWLDLKNLDEKNGAAVLAALRRLDARHSIRGRALVETGHSGPAAAALRAAGFQTSYYLVAASGCDPAKLESLLALRRFAAVSYDFKEREAAQRCAGDAVRKLKLRTYTWDLQEIDPARREAYAAYSGVLLPLRSRFADWR